MIFSIQEFESWGRFVRSSLNSFTSAKDLCYNNILPEKIFLVLEGSIFCSHTVMSISQLGNYLIMCILVNSINN